jgi:glycerophosphoryl diester phosphodiesterase
VRSVAVQTPVIVAHSGCNGSPANSLASIAAAHESGADAVEFDVQALADGYPVLVHDPWILRAGGTRIPVDALDRNGVEETALHPSIGMVCDACIAAGLRLNLDIKNAAVLPAVLDILGTQGFLDRTFLTGCRLDDVAAATDRGGELARSIETLVNIADEVRDPAFPVILDRLRDDGFAGVNIEYSLVSREVVDSVHRRGLIIGTWTVDNDAAIRQIHDLSAGGTGCDYVTTNVPDRLRSVYDLPGRLDE